MTGGGPGLSSVQVQSAEEMTPRHGSDAQERRDKWSEIQAEGTLIMQRAVT